MPVDSLASVSYILHALEMPTSVMVIYQKYYLSLITVGFTPTILFITIWTQGHIRLCRAILYPLIPIYKNYECELCYLTIVLLLGFDVETNPGPRKIVYSCMICGKAAKWGQRAIECEECQEWFHAGCMDMPYMLYVIPSVTQCHMDLLFMRYTQPVTICIVWHLINFKLIYWISESHTSDVSASLSRLSSITSEDPASPLATSSPKDSDAKNKKQKQNQNQNKTKNKSKKQNKNKKTW